MGNLMFCTEPIQTPYTNKEKQTGEPWGHNGRSWYLISTQRALRLQAAILPDILTEKDTDLLKGAFLKVKNAAEFPVQKVYNSINE